MIRFPLVLTSLFSSRRACTVEQIAPWPRPQSRSSAEQSALTLHQIRASWLFPPHGDSIRARLRYTSASPPFLVPRAGRSHHARSVPRQATPRPSPQMSIAADARGPCPARHLYLDVHLRTYARCAHPQHPRGMCFCARLALLAKELWSDGAGSGAWTCEGPRAGLRGRVRRTQGLGALDVYHRRRDGGQEAEAKGRFSSAPIAKSTTYPRDEIVCFTRVPHLHPAVRGTRKHRRRRDG
ncbi:hypothetical protein B0H12DRAFT_411106 [Mycena haematopus]|nr:hypothetical protein B0H12DRAFT_411106 [Mycena haematopus]